MSDKKNQLEELDMEQEKSHSLSRKREALEELSMLKEQHEQISRE